MAAVNGYWAGGPRAGVRGTPTIFVNGRLLQARSLDGFKQAIDPILQGKSGTPSATASN
jgi:protein-disulfide isomerase